MDDIQGGMKKPLGTFGVFSIAAGAMISSGLFVLPGLAFAEVGPGIVLSYALASLLMVPTMLSQAELATAMPRAGGSYFFIERSLGPIVGCIAGFANWLSIVLKGCFALIGLGGLVAWAAPSWGMWAVKAVAVLACIFFVLLSLRGTSSSGRFQSILVVLLLVIVWGFVLAGLRHAEARLFEGTLERGVLGLAAAAGMVFVSFGGLTKVVDVSEEVHDPGRSIPRGMFSAFLVVSAMYVAVVFVVVGTTPPEVLSGSLTPLFFAADRFMGGIGRMAVGSASFLAFVTTANAALLSASRSPLAMARDGLLPAVLAKVDGRGVPRNAVLLTGALAAAAILFLPVADLVKSASTMLLITFVLTNVAVIVMRKANLVGYRPVFRSPLFPWVQVAAVVVYPVLIMDMGTVPLVTTGGFVVAALVWYLVYVHARINKESAFIYLVRRIMYRPMANTVLEDELQAIALERDEVELDRFDALVARSEVVEVEGTISADEMFRRAAEILAGKLKMDVDRLYLMFLEREKESSTVVAPGIAIPHVVVDGEGIFEMVMFRAREGIVFSELQEPVRMAFVLVGSPDERNFHLRVLMTIAHIVYDESFMDEWMAVEETSQLRKLVVLSRKRRFSEERR